MPYIAVTTPEQCQQVIDSIERDCALDTETTDKDPKKAELLKIVLCGDGKTSYSIPAEFLPLLKPLVAFKRLRIQNFKYDQHVLYRHGLNLLKTEVIDPMLLHHLIDENSEHNLEYFTKTYYADDYKERFWGKYNTYEEATPEDALEYECKDAIYHYKLTDLFLGQLSGREHLIEHVHRLAKALLLTEIRGIRVDTSLIVKTKEEMGGKIAGYLPKLRQEFASECQEWEMLAWVKEIEKRRSPKGKSAVKRPEFNFGSGKQIQWLLYGALGLPVIKRTATKAPSTDYETVSKLLDEEPRLQTYKDYIDIKTIYGTFVEGLLDRVIEDRIFPEFNVNGTHTGRISHSNPNLGNLPKEGVYRNFFLPDAGHVLIGADYSQLEVVIEAHVTDDKNLARIIMEGASKHDITAQGLGIPRDLAKTINFALGYHAGIKKLAKLLKCSFEEAEYQYNKYWELYSGCRDLKKQTDLAVLKRGYVTNFFGRTRHLPGPFANEWQLAGAQRQAYNFMVQGPGADIMNVAFYRYSEHLESSGSGRALWTIHDEQLASVKKSLASLELAKMVETMEQVPKELNLKLPLKAKGYGPLTCWAKA